MCLSPDASLKQAYAAVTGGAVLHRFTSTKRDVAPYNDLQPVQLFAHFIMSASARMR